MRIQKAFFKKPLISTGKKKKNFELWNSANYEGNEWT